MSPCDPFPPTASANTKDSLPLADSRELVSTSGRLTYERITDCPITAHHLLANSLLTLLTSCDLLRWQVLGLAPLLVLGGRSAIHLDAGPPLCAFLHQPSPHLIYAYAYVCVYVCVHACICRGARTHAHTYIYVFSPHISCCRAPTRPKVAPDRESTSLPFATGRTQRVCHPPHPTPRAARAALRWAPSCPPGRALLSGRACSPSERGSAPRRPCHAA